MILWRSLLVVYPSIDVRVPGRFGFSKRFAHTLPEEEIAAAVDSFRCFPSLVRDLTDQAAGVEYEILRSERPLSTLSALPHGTWWPAPTDTAPEWRRPVAEGGYHSLFVFWPQHNLQDGTSLPACGWGLGMGASPGSGGATYATVANIHAGAWQIPLKGEVFLHEFLHGVCAHFAAQGHPMPDGDADGADRHGYVRSPETGWTSYYRDLMNARVVEGGEPKGIPTEAWRVPLSLPA